MYLSLHVCSQFSFTGSSIHIHVALKLVTLTNKPHPSTSPATLHSELSHSRMTSNTQRKYFKSVFKTEILPVCQIHVTWIWAVQIISEKNSSVYIWHAENISKICLIFIPSEPLILFLLAFVCLFKCLIVAKQSKTRPFILELYN